MNRCQVEVEELLLRSRPSTRLRAGPKPVRSTVPAVGRTPRIASAERPFPSQPPQASRLYLPTLERAASPRLRSVVKSPLALQMRDRPTPENACDDRVTAHPLTPSRITAITAPPTIWARGPQLVRLKSPIPTYRACISVVRDGSSVGACVGLRDAMLHRPDLDPDQPVARRNETPSTRPRNSASVASRSPTRVARSAIVSLSRPVGKTSRMPKMPCPAGSPAVRS